MCEMGVCRAAVCRPWVPPSQTMRDELGFRAWHEMWEENFTLWTHARRVGVIRRRAMLRPFALRISR